eukprot:46283-Eustigmatos_ZCMA.PRE.1
MLIAPLSSVRVSGMMGKIKVGRMLMIAVDARGFVHPGQVLFLTFAAPASDVLAHRQYNKLP